MALDSQTFKHVTVDSSEAMRLGLPRSHIGSLRYRLLRVTALKTGENLSAEVELELGAFQMGRYYFKTSVIAHVYDPWPAVAAIDISPIDISPIDILLCSRSTSNY